MIDVLVVSLVVIYHRRLHRPAAVVRVAWTGLVVLT
jgi:hypothetical protein